MDELPIHILQILSFFIVVAFLLWLLLGYVLKNRIKSSIILSFWATLFFSYGHVRLSLDGLFDTNSIEFIFITFGIYIISFIIFPIFVIKIKHVLDNIMKIIMVSAIIVMIMPVANIGQSLIYDNENVIETHQTNIDIVSYDGPDVYYILPDSYAGSKSMKAYWNFDNSDFENFLIENGFHIAQDSFSNYEYTSDSIPSTMNMEYVHSDEDSLGASKQNNYDWLIFDNFRSKGYTTYFIESGLYLNFHSNNIDNKLCSPSDIFDSFFIRNIFEYSMILQPGIEFLLKENLQDKIICSFDELDKMSENNVTPKFVLTHIMAPHSPFVFGPTGEDPPSLISNIGDVSTYRDNLYTDQMQFVNYKLENIITKLLDTDNPPVIIIQSDHGKRTKIVDDDPIVRDIKQLNNFRAYYIPNGDRNLELENSSPVNTFRVLFNTYFDYNYELLENKFYILTDAKTRYIDITNSLTDLNN